MALSSFFTGFCVAVAASAGLVHGALAQSRAPVIAIGETDIDPAKYDWLSEEGRKALQGAIDASKAGSLHAFVFAAAPGGNFWTYRWVAKPTDPYSISDLARQALQSCEYYANGSCFVVSINGKEARDATGSLPVQPRQLVRPPATFDENVVPFLGRDERLGLRTYRTDTRPRALAVTPNRTAIWQIGDNSFQAIANTLADCQKAYPTSTCLLYAVNDRVVFAPGGPY